MTGKLFVCATPIGNLEDITIRVLKVLRQVDIIACEDTRRTGKLLQRYKIRKPMVSYHNYSSKNREDFLLQELLAGKNIVLVSDAGMPGISDPGQWLVRQAIDQRIELEVLPGPSAFATALVLSGYPADCFMFAGFLPSRSKARRERLQELSKYPSAVIFYESPHRLKETLSDMADIWGEQRAMTAARELTKLHEEVIRGTIGEINRYFNENLPRGEFCLITAGYKAEQEKTDLARVEKEVKELLAQGIEKNKAFKMKALEYNVKKSDIYNYYHLHNLTE